MFLANATQGRFIVFLKIHKCRMNTSTPSLEYKIYPHINFPYHSYTRATTWGGGGGYCSELLEWLRPSQSKLNYKQAQFIIWLTMHITHPHARRVPLTVRGTNSNNYNGPYQCHSIMVDGYYSNNYNIEQQLCQRHYTSSLYKGTFHSPQRYDLFLQLTLCSCSNIDLDVGVSADTYSPPFQALKRLKPPHQTLFSWSW